MVVTIYKTLNIISLYNICKPILRFVYVYRQVYFICSKLTLQQKIKHKYFQTRGAYYMRNYEYFGILRAKVGVRIIRGCVLYAENYGKLNILTDIVSISY